MTWNLSLDEVLNNIISYAYAARHPHDYRAADDSQPRAIANIDDDGRPFNPLMATPPDPADQSKERPSAASEFTSSRP
jgi:hypothetical protein